MSSLRGNAIVIGAMKSGTTSLFKWLSTIRGIAASRPKDTKFFLNESQGGNYSKGLDWYAAQFLDNSETVWRMEASTHYSKYPDYKGVPKRISESLAKPKLIYVVRNPVERSLSHFFHNLVVDGTVTNINASLACFECKYFYYSDYALQLTQYLKYFRKDVLFIAAFLDINVTVKSTSALLKFLDIKTKKKARSHFCLSQENALASNIEKRNTKTGMKYSKANQRVFERLKETITSKPHISLVELALAFGLQKKILENMIVQLNKKVLEFEAISGINCQQWISQYECYI